MTDNRDFDVNGERFEPFRDQLQEVINQTLSSLTEKKMHSASITAKIDIELVEKLEVVRATGEYRTVLVPMMVTKAKFDAKFSGESDAFRIGSMDEKLVWDKTRQCWTTRFLSTDQASFDDDSDYDYDNGEEDDG